MAKTSREERDAKRKQRFLVAMMLIVAASMLFSGIYYINIGGGPTPTGEDQTAKLSLIEQYNIEPATSGSVLVQASEMKDELLAIPMGQCMSLDSIVELRNSSIDGVESVSCEVANPQMDPGYSIICGTFIMFRFQFDLNDSGTDERVREKLSNVLSEYSLMRGYVIELDEEVLGAGEIYIIGSPETKEGDYVRAVLFTRDLIAGGTGLLGLEERIVPRGPYLPATVVNITGISVGGSIPGEFNRQAITDALELNESEFNSQPPEFTVNGTLSAESLELIEADIQEVGNVTVIRFNGSGEEIDAILEGEGLPYSFKPGAVFFRAGLNSSTQNISSLLEENGVTNAAFQQTGQVSMPAEVIISDRLVPIENYGAFDALFYMDTEVGDEINISLNTFTFGEQIIPFGASEFRNETSPSTPQ